MGVSRLTWEEISLLIWKTVGSNGIGLKVKHFLNECVERY